MDYDRAKSKVQKLMALAQNAGASEGEADNALRQAEALMRKFGIEQSEIGEATTAPGFDWVKDFAPYGVPRQPAKSTPTWYGIVAVGVATFTDTITRIHYDREKGYGVGFYGDRADVTFAVWLITYLRDTVWRTTAKAGKENGWGRKENEDFRRAMAGRLQARMKQLRKERDQVFAEAGTGTALVVISDKLAKRDAEFGAQTYGKTAPRRMSHDAAAAGREAGDKVGFNRPLSGGNDNRRIGA